MLVDNIIGRKTGSCVTFADEGVSVKSFLLKDFTTLNAVADVGQVADAVDVGSVATEDTDVVEQSSFGDKVYVNIKGAKLSTSECFLHHTFTMNP